MFGNERVIIGRQDLTLDLQESIQVLDASGVSGGDEGAAATIANPDAFVGLVQSLLLVFPNGNRATQILDPNPANKNVTADDAMVIATVVPQLRAMLINTPREQRRRKTRKALTRYNTAKQVLFAAVGKVQSAFLDLIQALS